MSGGPDGTTLVAIGATIVSFLGVLLTVLSNRRDRRERAEIAARAAEDAREADRSRQEAEARRQALHELDVTSQRLSAENTRLAGLRDAAVERADLAEAQVDVLERDLNRARRTSQEATESLTDHLVTAQARSAALEALCRAHGLDVLQ